jgi:hypothetical protein
MGTIILGLALGFVWPVAPLQPPAGGTGERLDPKIPPADPKKYQSIRDAQDWANPILIIKADGIEVISKAIPSGRTTVVAKNLRKTLTGLPVDAWPYGRVVGIVEIGIRGEGQTEAIKRNKEAAEEVLKGLQVELKWWPPS